MNFWLIRHGLTKGNEERRYIGCRSDEPLSNEGRRQLRIRPYPIVRRVYGSPLLRCRETARILYPELSYIAISDFRECDFGAFEGLRYDDLKDDPAYRAWISQDGSTAPPGGENRWAFCVRSRRAFQAIWEREIEDSALIVHGGTIMAILEAFASPPVPFYALQPHCGEAICLSDDGRVERS